jgi:sarcosine oxidase subunit beta
MSSKVIVCRCEDVTLDDVQHTIEIGYGSVEEVKRYTGLGTGPCQGKECMLHAARLCAEAGAAETPAGAATVAPFTSRPPVGPVSFAALARGGEDPP